MTGDVPARPLTVPWSVNDDLTWEDASDGRWRYMHLGLLISCLMLVAAGVFLGEHPSPFSTLKSAVASGKVSVVRVAGGLDPRSGGGYSYVLVHWRRGLVKNVTTVVQVHPRRAAPRDAYRQGASAVVSEDVGVLLRRIHPGLAVEHVTGRDPDSSFFGLLVPVWIGLCGLLLGVAALVLLVKGPRPWRATRWAWFWLLTVAPPVGLLAFLLLGGPAGLPRPRDGARRLTGVWAFVLAAVVSRTALGS